jgi:hypothetical protein
MPAPVASERPPEEAQDFMHGLKTASANVRMQRTPMDHGIEVPELEVSLHILCIMLHVLGSGKAHAKVSPQSWGKAGGLAGFRFKG